MPEMYNSEEQGSGVMIDPRGLQDGKLQIPTQGLNKGGIATPKRGLVDEPGSYAGEVGTLSPRYSKVNKNKIVSYNLGISVPQKDGSRKRTTKIFTVNEYGSPENALKAAEAKRVEVSKNPVFQDLQGNKQKARRADVVRSFLNHLKNNQNFDGYEKIADELKDYRLKGDKAKDVQYQQINKDFRQWKEGKFEVEGIDRKDLSANVKEEIKNWSPKMTGERSKVKEEQLRFLDKLNNEDLPLKTIKQKFKKEFGKGKYYTDKNFSQRVDILTQLKREGAVPSNADGSRTLSYGVRIGARAPWLKKALSDNIAFNSNYSRLVRAADLLETKGKIKEAKRLNNAAKNFFGTNGVFRKLPGNAEHPLSVSYGGADNLLKVDSLVKGDLNQLKKVVFDTPLKKLTGEYNDPKRVTTAKRKNEIKTLLENRKSFMNYLTSGSVDKGIVESVSFNFTPKKVTASSSVTPVDQLSKNYDFGTFVEKGEDYSKVFAKKGKEFNLITKDGLAKRTAVSDKKLAKGLSKILDCKLEKGVNCDDPMSYYKSLKEQEQIAAKGKGPNKIKAVNKVKAAKNLLYGTFGFGALAVEAGIAAPLAGYEFFQGALPSEILNTATYGLAGKDRDELIQEQSGKEIFKARDFLETGEKLDALRKDPIYGGYRGKADRIEALEDTSKKFRDQYQDSYFADPITGEFSPEIFGIRQQQQIDAEAQEQKQRDQLKQERKDKYTDTLSGLELFASGGLANLTRTIPPEKGPQSQGLAYFMKNGKR